MTKDSNTITEFLEARIAEDEAQNKSLPDEYGHCDYESGAHYESARVLAECAAKRAVVHYCAGLGIGRRVEVEVDGQFRAALWISRQMAAVYSDHADYRQEWAA